MDPKQQQYQAPPPYGTAQYPPGAYPGNQGYPPPQQGYPPPQQGYPPPQQGYPPPQQGFPQGGYAPPTYMPGPQMQHSSSNTNVVVVGGQAPGVQTVVVQRQGVNHALHFCISLFFWPWIIVWIILCITDDS